MQPQCNAQDHFVFVLRMLLESNPPSAPPGWRRTGALVLDSVRRGHGRLQVRGFVTNLDYYNSYEELSGTTTALRSTHYGMGRGLDLRGPII